MSILTIYIAECSSQALACLLYAWCDSIFSPSETARYNVLTVFASCLTKHSSISRNLGNNEKCISIINKCLWNRCTYLTVEASHKNLCACCKAASELSINVELNMLWEVLQKLNDRATYQVDLLLTCSVKGG